MKHKHFDVSQESKGCVKTRILIVCALGGAFLVAAADPPQKDWRRLLPSVSGNLAITKERAESGDVLSQVELADLLTANQFSAQAVEWYRKAAEQGNLRAKYRLGEILLFGVNDSGDLQQRVIANPAEGLRWTFAAATNFHAEASHNMARALEKGIGLDCNLVEAYAWLEVYARSNAPVARAEMDRLALRMGLQEIREAHTVAVVFLGGHWPEHAPRKASEAVPWLKLNGITVGPVSLAIINGHTFEEGDSGEVRGKDGLTHITCLKIDPDAVRIAVQGESEPRTLTLK